MTVAPRPRALFPVAPRPRSLVRALPPRVLVPVAVLPLLLSFLLTVLVGWLA